MNKVKKATIKVDNYLSPAHTLLQIQCIDQKGVMYDILRTAKDCKIQVSYGHRDLNLFIQRTDGGKILDDEDQSALCSRLKEEMLHPLRVTITNELLVANTVELSGKGRPRVFYDVTFALKMLGICVFTAEIGRHSTADWQWEIYRFLLVDSVEFPLASNRAKTEIVHKVRRTLMGWSENHFFVHKELKFSASTMPLPVTNTFGRTV